MTLDFVRDLTVSALLSRVETDCLRLVPLIPAKIAQMEGILPHLSGVERETVEHLIKVEKIILFCGTELKTLEGATSDAVKQFMRKGPLHVVKGGGS